MEVTKPRGWKPFVQNDNKLLWLGLLTRDTGIPASQRLQIRDEVVALDFDLAVSLRLFRFDNEKSTADAKRLVLEIDKWWNGRPDDVLDSEFVDKYTDASTEVW